MNDFNIACANGFTLNNGEIKVTASCIGLNTEFRGVNKKGDRYLIMVKYSDQMMAIRNNTIKQLIDCVLDELKYRLS